jgi:gamma-glutamyltranspeptidase/glutathione hydrolase
MKKAEMLLMRWSQQISISVFYPQPEILVAVAFMVSKANGETGTLDYREKAPIAATKDMY